MLRRTLLVPAAAMNWQTATIHQDRCATPTFGEAFKFWLKLGFISFGGPTGQIAIMQTELVEKKRWISQSRFLHALNFCMLLPARKRNSSPSTSAGFFTKRGAASSPAHFLSSRRFLFSGR